MINYDSLLRPLLFAMPPEVAHALTLRGLAWLTRAGLAPFFWESPLPDVPRVVMGLTFPNCVGLAAGLDKNAECLDGFATFGFGFVEVGTLTPKPQGGNPKPRLFRIQEADALINRMGFNNVGIDVALDNIQKSHYRGIVGVNIGKNAATPIEQGHEDYLVCFQKAYPYAAYVTVNVSSPNTPQLRNLQFGDALNFLLTTLKEAQCHLQNQYKRTVPLVLKVSPDLTEAEIEQISAAVLSKKIEGVIATNTTVARPFEKQGSWVREAGGLSGAPLRALALQTLKLFMKYLQGKTPIISSGGIMTREDAQRRLDSGASLVQLYTGLIYRGPQLVHEIARL